MITSVTVEIRYHRKYANLYEIWATYCNAQGALPLRRIKTVSGFDLALAYARKLDNVSSIVFCGCEYLKEG